MIETRGSIEMRESRRELHRKPPLVRAPGRLEESIPPFGPPKSAPSGEGLDHKDGGPPHACGQQTIEKARSFG